MSTKPTTESVTLDDLRTIRARAKVLAGLIGPEDGIPVTARAEYEFAFAIDALLDGGRTPAEILSDLDESIADYS